MVRFLSFCFYITLVCVIPASGFATPPADTDTLTIQDAVDEAIKNNYDIKKTQQSQKSAAYGKKAAIAEMLPSVSANYRYANMSEIPVMKMDMGSMLAASGLPASPGRSPVQVGEHENVSWDVTVTQPLFTGFALSNNYKKSRLDLDIKALEVTRTKIEVAADARKACYNLLLAQKMAAVAEDAVKSLTAHRDNSEKFYAKGMIPFNDLLKIKVALADAQQTFEKAAASVSKADGWLHVVLGREDAKKTSLQSDVNEPEGVMALNWYLDEGLKRRPEIKILKNSMKSADSAKKIAGSAFYPHVYVIGRYERSGDDLLAEENIYSNEHNSTIAVNATWNLFESGKTRAGMAKFHHAKLALTEQLNGTKALIRYEIEASWTDLKVAEKNITTSKGALSQARENKRITDLQYHQQMAASTDVLDAQSFLSGIEKNYYEALYGYMSSLADLERAAGIP